MSAGSDVGLGNIVKTVFIVEQPAGHGSGVVQFKQVAQMGQENGSGRSADPMDVPREIARLHPPGAMAQASVSTMIQPKDFRSCRTKIHST